MKTSALRKTLTSRLISSWIVFCFIVSAVTPPRAFAQGIFSLPEPGTMVLTSQQYVPVILKGLAVHQNNPLLFDFIVDTGYSGMDAKSTALRWEAEKLVKYFLASLTIPENDQWVNLSPYEKDRMMAENLAKTDLGRDMLAQDYLLKQVTASAIYPEQDLGKTFWDKVYSQAKEKFGATDIPMDTFNKVWVVADKANIYVNRDKAEVKDQLTAYIVGSHLKVMLESDYLARQKSEGRSQKEKVEVPLGFSDNSSDLRPQTSDPDPSQDLAKQIIREVVLPALEKEVNEGKNFANLRQLFHSMILATWYKKALKQSFLAQVYANKGKTGGVELGNGEKGDPQVIYAKYVEAYKKGAFNYIKEEIDQATGEAIARRYVSGGLTELARADEVGPKDFSQKDVLPVGSAVVFTVKNELSSDAVQSEPVLTGVRNIVDQLNKERPQGYPERNAQNRPKYTNPKIKLKENVWGQANVNGYAHEDVDVLKEYLRISKDSPTMRARMRAEIMRIQALIRREIGRFASWVRFENGMPKNYVETGLTGRGDLGRYGPNPAETAALLRRSQDGGVEVLVKERSDGGGVELAGMFIPFGQEMTEFYGRTATKALKRELGLDVDMTKATQVYEGPAYDWRDTNDAWVLDRGLATLLSYEESLFLKPEAREGTKPGSVRWVAVDQLDQLGFYARHKTIIENAAAMVKDGRIQTAEERLVSKFAPLNTTTTQIEKAFQAFKERKTVLQRTFDIVIPKAPHGGNYFVAAGIEPVLNDVRRLRFSPDHIQALEDTGRFDSDIGREFLKYLREFEFKGDFDALQEGRIVQEGTPIMRVRANEVEIELLSDLLRNRLGQAVLIATKTSRIVQAANGAFVSEEAIERLIREQGLTRDQIIKNRDVIDMSLRRAQGDGGFLAARASVTGGAVGTSNEKAAMDSNLIDIGSMAHAYMQAFGPNRQKEAFREWAKMYPKTSIFLPDTFGDTIQGIRDAIEVAKEMETWGNGARLYGIRLDSGDQVKLSIAARKMLDEAGLHYVKIVSSNDLDEDKITELIEKGARIDVFGVGTQMGTGGKQATLDVQVTPSDGKRYWRSTVNGKITGYVTTPAGRVAYANKEKGEQVTELLLPIWGEGGKRVQGIELSWSGHERTMGEMSRLFPDQKKLQDAKPLPVVHQDTDLTINKETDIVLYVDDQDAFKPGRGGLAVAGGDQIAEPIRQSIELFEPEDRYYSLDQHERGSVSLASSFVGLPPYTVLTYDMVKDWTDTNNQLAEHAKFTVAQLQQYLKEVGFQVLWTDHADERSPESRLPGYINPGMLKFVQMKGMDPTTDSYSPFEDNRRRTTYLAEVIRKNKPGTKRVILAGGLAFDYCVGFAALGAVKDGFEVILVRDATRSVGFPPGNIEAMENLLREKGVKIVDSTDLLVAANNTQGVYPASIVQGNFSHPPLYDPQDSTAFVKDKYHSTMVNILVKLGLHKQIATFDYFFRRAPYGQDRITISGLRILAERLRNFKFTPEQIQFLRRKGIYSEEFLKYLEGFKFTGNIVTLREGSVGFANEDLFKFTGPLAEVLIVESLILNKLNFNSLIATLANLKRLDAGDMERLIEAGLAGAQGEAHSEASLSAVHGGMDGTTNLDAILNFGLPSAWSNEEGVTFGADLVTGEGTPALGGVYKGAEYDGVPSIKISEDSGKTTRPGNKEIWDIEDSQGRVLDRVNSLVGEKLDLPEGQRAVSPYVPFMTNGEIVFKAEDPFEVSAWRAEQNIRYARIRESHKSPGLIALEQKLIADIRGTATTGQDAAMVFKVGGVNNTEAIRQLKELGGRTISEVEQLARPGMLSMGGFLGPKESFVEVLANDNDFVLSNGFTHQQLAQALSTVISTRSFGGQKFKVSKTQYRGWQDSLFKDGLTSSSEYTITRESDGKVIEFSALLVEYIARYGFYEGKGTSYRLDPRTIIQMFFPEKAVQEPTAAVNVVLAASAAGDAAMKGGIDLDAGKMSMTETGDKADMTFDNAMMEQFRSGDFSGITPVIIRVTPLSTVLPLLGLNPQEGDVALAATVAG